MIASDGFSASIHRTLFLGETEITLTPNGQRTADRYHSQQGAPTVIRTTSSSDVVSVMLPDLHDTATTAVSTAPGMPIRRRKITPYGEDRGTAPQLWPGKRGFVDGQIDDTTDPTLNRHQHRCIGSARIHRSVIDMGRG